MAVLLVSLALVVTVGPFVEGGPIEGSRGVAIDLGRIEIRQKLTPGASYRLPTMGVRNAGTEIASYELQASPLRMTGRQAPPQSWFAFRPARLTLKPNETRSVKVRIDLPRGADPGDYVALVGPQIVTRAGGTQNGGAASRVSFTVRPANALQAFRLKVRTFVGDAMPWPILVGAFTAFALLTWGVLRRLALRIQQSD